MSTFRSHAHELGERIDVADCIVGSGVRLAVDDPEWNSGDGCTLLEPDDARRLGRLLFQAAARVDEARAERDARDD